MAYAIYKITNTRTQRVYIGLTQHTKTQRIVNTEAFGPLQVRLAEHLGGFRRRDHFNPFMQQDFEQYGHESFRFEVLEVTDPTVGELEARELERRYIKSQDAELYNIRSHRREPLKNRGMNRVEIMKRVRAGEPGKAIALDMGVSPAAVSLIRKASGESRERRNNYEQRVRTALADPVIHMTKTRAGQLNLNGTAKKHGIPRTAFRHWMNVIQKEQQ